MRKVFRFALMLQALLWFSVTDTAAEGQKEVKFHAVLLWGTNGEKPKDQELKDVDPRFEDKLKKILKWANYYEVSRTFFSIKVGEKKGFIALSKQCEIVVFYPENAGFEVELIGEGKSLVKTKQSMPLKEPLVVAGDAKNETAWVLVIKSQE